MLRWSPKGTFELEVNFDMTKQPNETQEVSFLWESWMYSTADLDIHARHDKPDGSNLFDNIG